MKRRSIRLFSAVSVFFVLTVHAWTVAAQELARNASFVMDNDYFNYWQPIRERPDDNYTQGMRVLWDRRSVPQLGRRLACGRRPACGSTIEIGQEMYTPTIDSPEPVPGQRPYAGWLYGRFTVRSGDTTALRRLAFSLGVTGKPSLAGALQTEYHRYFSGRRPLGWDKQLAAEPAFTLAADRSWRFMSPGSAGKWTDVVPTVAATLGTLRTSASGGARLRASTNLEHPWLATGERKRAALYVFAGAQIEAVVRDLFLDGSTFRESQTVERSVMLPSWERGTGIRLGRFSAEYRVVTTGREYTTGPPSHTYSALRGAWAFR